jgi:hypothetical protein
VRPSRSPLNQIIGATILLVVAGVLFFPAYLYWNGSIRHSVTALATCGPAPRYETSDQTGRPIGTTELSGIIWVAGFVNFSRPDEAELLFGKFAELDQNFRGVQGLTLVSFFIGAEKNALKDYAQRYEASDHWHLVLIPEGAPRLVQDWASPTAGCRGRIGVENLFVLIDRQGKIRNVYDATAPETVQKILIDVGNLLRAER